MWPNLLMPSSIVILFMLASEGFTAHQAPRIFHQTQPYVSRRRYRRHENQSGSLRLRRRATSSSRKKSLRIQVKITPLWPKSCAISSATTSAISGTPVSAWPARSRMAWWRSPTFRGSSMPRRYRPSCNSRTSACSTISKPMPTASTPCFRRNCFRLTRADPHQIGNRALISAGTGLGEAGMLWDGLAHRPFASEGGHASFAPNDTIGDELLTFCARTTAT